MKNIINYKGNINRYVNIMEHCNSKNNFHKFILI